jgi:RluA family pseudouridine synthase
VPIRKLKLITTADQAEKRLDEVLTDWLGETLGRAVSKAKARKLIMAGAVHLNGKGIRIPSIALKLGAAIEAHLDLAKLFGDSTSRDRKFDVTPNRILFEDADLIVINKPPGLPAHPTLDPSRDSLFAAVSRFLNKRDGGAPYLGIHHRLDRDTSGVVLFTKSRRVNAAIGEIFSRHEVIKVYQALTAVSMRSDFSKHWTIRNRLGKVSVKGKQAKYGSVRSGDLAETSFRVIEQCPGGVWIEATPKTGRTHQIRVHLSEYGLPIIGDDFYGVSNNDATRLMLHASRLTFRHPVTGSEITVESALPQDFRQCLDRIGSRFRS